MSDHDSDYSTDSDPPRQHPIFAAMDRITASVTAARVTDSPSKAAASISAPPRTTAPQATSHDEAQAQQEVRKTVKEEVKEWPLLILRDFTIYTIATIKNGEMENEAKKTSMSEKYKAYCHDHELMKPVLDVLAHCDDQTRDMVHQLVHTMLANRKLFLPSMSISLLRC